MPIKNSKVKAIYNALRSGNDFTGSEDEFLQHFEAPGQEGYKNRLGIYQTLKSGGADIGASYEEFSKRLGMHAVTPTPSTSKPAMTTAQAWDTLRRGGDNTTAQLANDSIQKAQTSVTESTRVMAENGHTKLADSASRSTGELKKAQEAALRAHAAEDAAKAYWKRLGKEERDKMLADVESRLLELRKKAQAEADKGREAAIKERSELYSQGYAVPSGAAGLSSFFHDEKRSAALVAIDKQLEDIAAAREGRGFWRGILDFAKNPRNWTFGVSQLAGGMATYEAAKKAQEGKPLTAQEKLLLQSVAEVQQNEGFVGSQIDDWYRYGQGTGESLQMAGEMALTGGVTGAIKGAVKKGVQKLGTNMATKALGSIAGSALAGAAQSAMLGSADVGADAFRRMTGSVTPKADGSFDITEQEGAVKATAKAFGAHAIENATEYLGGEMVFKAVGKGLSKGGGLLKKGIEKIPFGKTLTGKTSILLENLAKTDIAKATKAGLDASSDLLKKAQVHSIPAEMMEEEIGHIANALLVGDQSIFNEYDEEGNVKKAGLFNMDTQRDIALGTLFTMGVMHAPIAGLGAKNYLQSLNKLRVANRKASVLFDEEWDGISEKLENANNDEIVGVVNGLMNNGHYTNDQAEALTNYVARMMNHRGYTLGEALRADAEKNASAEEAYVSGYNLDSPDLKQRARYAYEMHKDFAAEVLGMDDEQMEVAFSTENAESTMQGLIDSEQYTEAQLAKVQSYVQARQHYEGMLQRVRDEIEEEVVSNDTALNSRAHTDGMIRPAKLNNGQQVYIVDGDIRLFDDGSTIDSANSSSSILVRDAKTGKPDMISPDAISSLGEVVDASFQKELSAQEISERIADAATKEIEGAIAVEAGAVYPMLDLDGNATSFQVIPNAEGVIDNGDGTINVSFDGLEGVYAIGLEDLQSQVDEYRKSQILEDINPEVSEVEAVQETELTPTVESTEQSSTPEEKVSALSRVPVDETTGEPVFERADRETALAALNELMGGNADNTAAVVNAQVNQATSELENLRKKAPKKQPPKLSGSPMAMIQAQQQAEADHQAALAAYQSELSALEEKQKAWNGIAMLMRERERAVRDAQQAEFQEKEGKLREEAVARLEENKRLAAEKQVEQAAIGAHAVNPKIKEKWDAAPKIEGKEHAITLEDGSTLRGRYILTESGAATASHDVNNAYAPSDGFPVDENGQSVNDRDYGRDTDAQNIVRQIADYYDSRAVQTPVVVSRDGVVLSGNNRTMSGELAAEMGTDKAYINHLLEYGNMFGFSEQQIASMQHPRVLFVPDEVLPYDTKTFARFNAEGQKKQSKPEHAVKLGKVVPNNVFSGIAEAIGRYDRLSDFYADEKAVDGVLRDLMGAGVINEMQLPELRTDNSLSAAGRELIENTLIGKVFQASPDAVRQIISTPTVRQSVVMGLSEIAHNRTLDESGYGLSEELGAAIDLVNRAKLSDPDLYKEGMPVSPFGREAGLFDDELGDSRVRDGVVLLLADVLNSGKPSDLRKVLSLYNSEASDAAGGQADLFSGAVTSKEEILNQVIEHFRNATSKEQQALVDAAIAERKRRSTDQQSGGNETGEQIANTSEGGAEGERASVSGELQKLLSEEEVSSLLNAMERNAMPAPEIELTPNSWSSTFDENDSIETPIGSVKMGAGQIAKFFDKNRTKEFGMVQPTLQNPDVIIAEKSAAKDGNAERESSYIFVKTFERNGEKIRYYASITVKKDGMEVSVSSHLMNKNAVRKKMSEGGIVYKNETLFPNSSELHLAEHQDDVPDLLPTQGNNVSSTGKVTKTSENSKGLGEKIALAEKETEISPTEAQKEAGNYKKGHVRVDGMNISIEQPKGSIRSGKDNRGKAWSTEMQHTYGYIRGTESVDGDHIDIFLSDNPESGNVFVVDQVGADGSFDEHKVMYGFGSIEEAKAAYLSNYSEGWQGLGNITEVSKEDFKKWIDSSKRKTKPFAEYKSVKNVAYSDSDYSITPSTYVNKKGKESEMSLLRFERSLTDEQQRAINEFAKEKVSEGRFAQARGWKDRASGGWMFRSKEDAQKAVEMVSNEEAVADAQPMTAQELREVVEPVPAKKPTNRVESSEVAEQPAKESQKYEVSDEEVSGLMNDIRDLLGIGEEEGDSGLKFREPDGLTAEQRQKLMSVGQRLAMAMVERGHESFNDYASMMVKSLGDKVRPWLKAFYGGLEYVPGYEKYALTSYDEVRAFDVESFDKAHKDVIAQAEMIVEEGKAEVVAAKAKTELKQKRNQKRKDADKQIESSKAVLSEDVDARIENERDGRQRLLDAYQGKMTTEESVEGNAPIDELFENNLSNEREDVNSPVEVDLFGEPTAQPQKETKTSKKNGLQRIYEPSTEGVTRNGVQPSEGLPGSQGTPSERIGQESGRTDERRVRKSTQLDRSLQPGLLGEAKNTRNHRGERGVDYAPKGVDARINANLEAIELAQQLVESGEMATPDQMAVLRRYSGWGGLGKGLSEAPAYQKSAPSNRLKALLGEDGFREAVMSANSAYYTPSWVCDALWDIAQAMGFEGGRILEGSAGVGGILAQMPASVSERSDIHAVEIDGTTGSILGLLYPDAKVEVQGFEATRVPNGSVDLAITNVPFVTGLRVADTSGDKDLSKRFHNIHDFCIAKNVRKLREGGIGIFITSSGTLDNSQSLRQWLVQEGGADVVGAFRLNNETFFGTAVTSDIIVVRKRVNGYPSAHVIDVKTVGVARTADYKTGKVRKVKGLQVDEVKPLAMTYNQYFMEHPEKMGGEMSFGFEHGDTYRPESRALYPKKDGKSQSELLADFIAEMQSKDWEYAMPPKAHYSEINYESEEWGENVKEGSLVINKDGEICQVLYSRAVPLSVNTNKVKGTTKSECLSAYHEVKNALQSLLDYQVANEDDGGLQPLLDALNTAYDKFVGTYGSFHKNTAIAFLRNDVDFSNIASLENVKVSADKEGNRIERVEKSDIFAKRIVMKESTPIPTNVKDGVFTSMFTRGRVDVSYIAEALGKREEEVKSLILSEGLGFESPITGTVEAKHIYLSGNVREKLAQAEANNINGKYDANIAALKQVVPMDIPAHLIDINLGASWAPVRLYTEFIADKTGLKVGLTNAGGSWAMDAPYYVDTPENKAGGYYSEKLEKRVYLHELIDAALTNKSIQLSKTVKHWDGSTETIVDRDGVMACTQKVEEIRQEFKEWTRTKLQGDGELSAEVARIYNEEMNNYVPLTIPDEYVTEHFPGANRAITMRPHQSKAVVRATLEPVMFAHEVGTGKTFTLITTAMEMRRLGTARKPMIVVQNATVGQFVSSAKFLYPNAKVLTLEANDMSVEGRKQFYAKIRYNDWDMVVVPQSALDRIPDSPEREMDFINAKIEEKLKVLEMMKKSNGDKDGSISRQAKRDLQNLRDELGQMKTAKELKNEEKSKQNASAKAQEMLDRDVDDVLDFDQMGIDALLVDEAHEYKHLGFETAMQRGVKGVDPSYSKKSQGLYLKAQSVLEKSGGRNVVFATGTPISNTAAEIWTFMRYLMPKDVMEGYGIYYFDDFVRNFGSIQQMLEFSTSGKFKENNRFAGYTGLPELVRIWSKVADTVRTQDANDVQDKIPELEGGKAEDIYLPQTKALRTVMKFVKAQLAAYEEMSGKEKKENSHIPLNMYGIAKAAAVDARLVMVNAPDEPNSKTNEAVRQTLRSLEETKSYRGIVALFADNYQNKQSGFNLYENIREKLIAEGVPAEQIVVMKPGMKPKQKLDIFDKANRGEIRVLLGSTATLGTGVNIQERLHTLIHLDAPNRPMDYTQRNGRILRQGNLHKDMEIPVRVLRFGVEDSLDVTAYQRLKTKGAIAESIMNGKSLMSNAMENRVLEEADDLFGDTVAQLSGSEYAMVKNQAEKAVRKYEGREKQWQADQAYIFNMKPKVTAWLKGANDRLAVAKDGLAKVRSAIEKGGEMSIFADKLRFSGIEQMEDFFKDHNKKVLSDMDEVKAGHKDALHRNLSMTIGGFTFEITTDVGLEHEQRGTSLFAKGVRKMTYRCDELGLDGVNVKGGFLKNAVTDILDNVLSGKTFEEDIRAEEILVARHKSELEGMSAREGKPFEYSEELVKAKNLLAEATEKMKAELAEKEAKYAAMDADVSMAEDVVFSEDDEASDSENSKFRLQGDDEVLRSLNEQMSDDAMVGRVTELSEKLNTPVRIIRSAEELAQLPTERQRRMKGSFNPMARRGEAAVTIVLPNHSHVGDIENTFIHEAIGHDGLRLLFDTEEKLNNALDELYRVSEGGIQKTIDQMAERMYQNEVERLREQKRKEREARGEDANAAYYADMAAAHVEANKKRAQFRRTATEEYGADLAGRIGEKGFENMTAEELTFWGKLKAMLEKALQRLLRGLGIPNFKKWGDKEWAFVYHEAYKRKKNGGHPTIFDAAETYAMREKTGFGETMYSDGNKKSAQLNEAALKHLEPIDVEHVAKVEQKRGIAKEELAKVAEIYKNTTDSKGFISDLINSLGLMRGNTGSGYGSFETPNGKVFTIRISNHNINTSHVGSSPVESIVIKTKRSPNRFQAEDGKYTNEYVYFKEDIRKAPAGTLSNIAEGIAAMLETGEYHDKTGLAKENHSPIQDVSQGKALYLDKEKIQTLIDQQRTNLADVDYLDLDSVANIVESFENPNLSDENFGETMYSDGKHEQKSQVATTIADMKQRVTELFEKAKTGEFVGKPASIGRLSVDGKAYLEKLSDLKFKEFVDFVLNPSDLNHIRSDHYGENEKDKGNNVPLTDEDIQNMVDVLNQPDGILYGVDKKDGRKLFFFLKDAGNGLYNLTEVCSTKKGNLTAKSFFKSKKKGISQRVMEIKDSLLPTSVTYSGEFLSSDAKIPTLFEMNEGSSKNVADDGLLFRDGDYVEVSRKAEARETYERRMRSGWYQAREALQDSMLSLKVGMQEILKSEGVEMNIEEIPDYENAYTGENHLSSVNYAEIEAMERLLFEPLMKEVYELGGDTESGRQEIIDYMMAKHGLERNQVMAERESKQAYRDYSGLTTLFSTSDVVEAEQLATEFVQEFEDSHDTNGLWEAVNKANRATLSKYYESGMMGKEEYESILAMYEHYIPLRGFDETTSDEVYSYLSKNTGVMTTPIKHAKGRTSKADDPFAQMKAMAETAVIQGNRNTMVKQRALTFALNHPSDLLSVSELWVMYDDVNDEWRAVTPEGLGVGDSPAEVEAKLAAFEEKMTALAESDPGHYKKGKEAINIPYRVVGNRNQKEHQVIVKRGGKAFVLTVNGSPRLAQALNGQTNPDNDQSGAIGSILKAGEYLNRQLSAMYTTRNPDFIVSNFMRDMLYSNTMVWAKETPNYALRFHKNVGRCHPATMKILFTKFRNGTLNMGDQIERSFHLFMMNGGETGYTSLRDIETQKKDLLRMLEKSGDKLTGGKVVDFLTTHFDEVNRSVENTARFAAFLTSRELGRSIGRSVHDAKEISVNFNKKGSGAKFLGAQDQTLLGNAAAFTGGLGRSLFIFWNASIQGMTNFGRATKRHPAKALTDASVMFLLGALMPYLGHLGDDDDDDVNAYKNLPEHVRRTHLMTRLGDTWLSLPLPVEYRAIYGMGELMSSIMINPDAYTAGDIAMGIASQMSQTLPLDVMEGSGGWSAFTPSSVKPIVESYGTERSWTGMPLYKDTPYNTNMPEWTKAYSSANQQLVGLSRILNEASGGDDFKKGLIDFNPAKIENMLKGYFGGLYSTGDKLIKMGETLLGEREYNVRNMLGANRLFKQGDDQTEHRALNEEFYRWFREAEETQDLLKNYTKASEGEREDAAKYAEKLQFLNYSKEYGRYQIYEEYREKESDRKKWMKYFDTPADDAESKKEEMDLKRSFVQKIRAFNKGEDPSVVDWP